MNKQQYILTATATAIILALAACGGGSGGTSSTLGSDVVTTQGVITGFGSVFVDGVEYTIPSGTAISIDGNNASESELQVGMLVTIKGSIHADGKTGVASSIEYSDEMEGVVTANAITANGTGVLTVMGQTVNVTADTIFDSKVASITSPNLIQVGNIVEVSGYASSTGVVTATRIEVKASVQSSGAIIEVKGIISNLDTTNSTFNIGALKVDYKDLPATALPYTALVNGQYIEVKSTTAFDGSGPLIASKIKLTDDGVKGHEGTMGEGLEIKGLVTADFANGKFELNGRAILIDSATRINNGTTAQLVTGTPVKVHSHYGVGNVLVADKIDFKNASKIELEGTLQAVDLTAGTLTLLDQVIYVNNDTLLLDKSNAAVRYFSIADLNPANSEHIEVNAYPDTATGHMIATKLEREDFSNQVKIKGPVDSGNGLHIAGVSVDTSTAIGSIPTLSNGEQVEVTGIYSGGILHASKISLDD